MPSRFCRVGLLILFCAAMAAAQTAPQPATLKIAGAVSAPLTLTIADLKASPRATLRVMNPHEKKEETYQGVRLETLLQKAGVPHGEQLRGQLMTGYVVAEAEDGYRVVFSLAELDSGFLDPGGRYHGRCAARRQTWPVSPRRSTREASGPLGSHVEDDHRRRAGALKLGRLTCPLKNSVSTPAGLLADHPPK